MSAGQKDPKLRWLSDPEENKAIVQCEILIDMPETTEDAAPWYTLTGLLKTCTEFIHKAIESSPIISSINTVHLNITTHVGAMRLY